MDAEAVIDQDAKLAADADRLGFNGDERKTWFAASSRTRGLMKAREHRRLKGEARAHSINPERYLEMMPDEREEALAEADRRKDSRRDEILAKHAADPGDEGAQMRVHTAGDEAPATDPVAARRKGVSVGPIVERVDDLFGDRAPRTLADIYARWPLGRPGGEEFYLRVERMQPKRFNGVPVAGFLGEIRHHVINEVQFGAYFGGEEYHVQLYGPDPKGRRDTNNDPIIKALTDAVNVTVPHRPPNLAVVPSSRPKQEKTMFDPNSPFGGGLPGQPQPAMSTADASIFKTAVDFVGGIMNKQQGHQPANADPAPPHLLSFLGDATTRQVDAAQKDADARERIYSGQLEQARKDAERYQGMMDDLKREIDGLKSNGAERSFDLAKLRDGDSSRLHDNYRIEIETLRSSHNEQIRDLNQRHNEEVKRMEERLRDQGETHRQALEGERGRREDEEKRLRGENTRVREEERSDTRRRLEDAKSRADERLKDQEKQHASELRVEKSNAETRVQTEITKMDYENTSLKDRLVEAEKSRDEARTEVEENKDPAAVIDKWTRNAKKMGFKKDEGESDKTFWQIVGKQAGQGLGQAIGNMDLPTLLGALKGASAPAKGRPQMPGAQGRPGLPPPAAAPPAGVSRRANVWASQGAPVAAPAQQPDQGAELGGGMAVGPPVPATQPATAQPGNAAPATGPVGPAPQPAPAAAASGPAQPQPQPQPAPQQKAPLPDHRLLHTFGEQGTFAFLQSLEGAINAAATPEEFAVAFCAQYPVPAQQLVAQFAPEDAVSFVQAMSESYPDALGSPVLREDGKKWLADLWGELPKHLKKPASGGSATA